MHLTNQELMKLMEDGDDANYETKERFHKEKVKRQKKNKPGKDKRKRREKIKQKRGYWCH